MAAKPLCEPLLPTLFAAKYEETRFVHGVGAYNGDEVLCQAPRTSTVANKRLNRENIMMFISRGVAEVILLDVRSTKLREPNNTNQHEMLFVLVRGSSFVGCRRRRAV